MNQEYGTMFTGHSPDVTSFLTASIPTSIPLTSGSSGYGPTVMVNTVRDLVTWGQHSVYNATDGDLGKVGFSVAELRRGIEREVLVSGSHTNNPATGGRTLGSGSFIMSGVFKSPNQTPVIGSLGTGVIQTGPSVLSNIGAGRVSWQFGGRSGISMTVTGRDLTAAVGGTTFTTGTMVIPDFAASSTDPVVREGSVVPRASPYLFLPEDKLIFGWQSAIPANVPNDAGSTPTPSNPALGLNLPAGKGKLTLYGSLITDGHEYHDGLNQPLTSDAIHEFIGFHGPPLDQFDTEPRQQFSGSMISSVVTGSMGAPDGYERRIVGERSDSRWIAGQPADPTDPDAVKMKPGSFYRSVITSEIDAEIYDSIPPSPLDIINANGFTLQVDHSVSNLSWGPYPSTSGPTARDHLWPRQFPFIPRFHLLRRKKLDLGLDRELQTNTGNIYQYPLVNCLIGDNIGPSTNFTSTPYRFAPSGTPISFLTGIDGYHNIIQIFFAIGGLGDPVIRSTKAPAYLNTPIQGYKYGLYHVIPKPALAHFRHSSYGQLRDMMEQRPDTRFLKSVRGRSFISYGPVWTRFISPDGTSTDPYSTSCSNMSNFSTSSLPYFDGVARNRGPVVTDELGTTVVSI